jgi:hypothetical protein
VSASDLSDLVALSTTMNKIRARLAERDRISDASGILRTFADAVFAFLPEHDVRLDSGALQILHDRGKLAVQEVIRWSSAEPIPPTPEHVTPQQSRWRVDRMGEVLAATPLFVRLVLWTLVVVVLVGLVTFGLGRLMPLSSETIATIIVPTSIGAAVVLAVATGRRPRPEASGSSSAGALTDGSVAEGESDRG